MIRSPPADTVFLAWSKATGQQNAQVAATSKPEERRTAGSQCLGLQALWEDATAIPRLF